MNKPKILILDIETCQIISKTWGTWNQNILPSQIVKDWNIISYAAKWLGSKKIFHKDLRHSKDTSNDISILKEVWKLLDDCDVLLTQNGVKFDNRKLNARFIMNGLPKPSSFKHIDTCLLAKKHFGFTSNKLEYLTNKLCKKYKKLKHKKFPGNELWDECEKGNILAWKEMERYNKHDVLALEELYNVMKPWDNTVNYALYDNNPLVVCQCGNKEFVKNGFFFTSKGKYQRYKCTKCRSESRDTTNLFSNEKVKSLRVKTT